jgi:hypothetical protein
MVFWHRLPRWARLTALATGTRLLALAAMVAGSYRPRPDDDLHWIGHQGDFFWDQVPIRVLDVWGRWDTMFYWAIARSGYPSPGAGWAYHAAYFPLFPALMRGLSELLGGVEPYLCGVFLAFAFFGLALWYLDRLVQLDHSPEFAERVLVVLLCYPGTHFLTCVYPESLTLFLAVFAVYAARTGLPLAAGLACMLAALARSSGVLVAAPVLLELLRAPGGGWQLRPRVLVLLLPVLSIAFWLGLNLERYQDPLYFVHVQAGWGRHPSFFLAPFLSLDLSLDHHLFALGGLALLGYGLWRRERPSYLALATLTALLPLSTGMLRGIHRYLGTDFPLFVFLARLLEGRPRWLTAWVVVGLGTMAGFAYKWGQGYQPN